MAKFCFKQPPLINFNNEIPLLSINKKKETR